MEAVLGASAFKTGGPVCRVVLRLNPNSRHRYINLGNLLWDMGRLKGGTSVAKKQGLSTFPCPFGLLLCEGRGREKSEWPMARAGSIVREAYLTSQGNHRL